MAWRRALARVEQALSWLLIADLVAWWISGVVSMLTGDPVLGP